MTNLDTSTLNGALEQLGITMADNLVTMGVSDADPSDGLTTLAGKILDIGPTPPTPTPTSLDLSLTAGKQILSYADVGSGTEYATFTATVLDQNDDPLPGASVSIYKDNVLWYTAETGAGGTISKTYDSEGVGDVSFHAVCGSFVTGTYSIEDCDYYNTSEVSLSSTYTTRLYDSNLSQPFPSNSEITYDLWSDNPYGDTEHRFFVLPKSQYSTNRDAQPNHGFFIDQYNSNRGRCGKRENGTIDLVNGVSLTTSQWHTIKYVRDGTTVDIYIDDVPIISPTITWLDEHSDWNMSMTHWRASGTSKIKNVKFKPL